MGTSFDNGLHEGAGTDREIAALKSELAARDQRIAELEQVLRSAADETLEKMTALRELRLALDKRATRQLEETETALHELSLAFREMNRELMRIVESLESAVGRLYRSRRWQMANFRSWFKTGFKKDAAIPHWAVENVLKDYRAWRASHPELTED